jgi:hypothetical protein
VIVHNPNALPDVPVLYNLLSGRPAWVRLGKFLAKARLQLEEAERVIQKEGPFSVDAYLNWRDLENDPLVCDVVATSLPTRLLAHAQFAPMPYYEAHFSNDVLCLPASMRFLARWPDKTKNNRRTKQWNQ